MKRAWDFLKSIAWIVGFMVLVVLPLQKKLGAQQGKKPVLTEIWSENEYKLDASLPWISEYRAPTIYRQWWQEIADCEGLRFPADSLKNVQYFQVNAPVFIPENVDAMVYAITYQNNQTFVAYAYIWNRALISHEALHLLLKWSGDPMWYEHDPVRFNSCGIGASGQPSVNQ